MTNFVNDENVREYVEKIKTVYYRTEFNRKPVYTGAEHGAMIERIKKNQKCIDIAFEMAEKAFRNLEIVVGNDGVRSIRQKYLHHCVQVAYLVATRTMGSYEEIVAALLVSAYQKVFLVPDSIPDKYSAVEIISACGPSMQQILESVMPTETTAFTSGGKNAVRWTYDDADRFVFGLCARRMMDTIKTRMSSTCDEDDLLMIEEAYALADNCHSHDAPRLSGEPYILHPINVALILTEHQVDANVIAAALLHDIHRNPLTQSYDFLESKFPPQVCGYVNASIEIKRLIPEVLENMKNIENYDIFSAFRNNACITSHVALIAALYIKAADKIHNLRTFDIVFDEENRSRNLHETKAYYLPLFKAFELTEFYNSVSSEVFRYEEPERYLFIEEGYQRLLRQNRLELNAIFKNIKVYIENFVQCKNHADESSPDDCTVEYSFIDYSVCDINDQLAEFAKAKTHVKNEFYRNPRFADEMDSRTPITKQTVRLKKLYVILTPKNPLQSCDGFAQSFISEYRNGLADKDYTIYDIRYRSNPRSYSFFISDRYCNRIEVIIILDKNYALFKTRKKMRYQKHKELVKKYLAKNNITVYTPLGKAVVLPNGSTVLDFAFAIHRDLCLYANDAIVTDIYGKERMRRIDHVLENGETVRIRTAAPDADGKRRVRASIRWISTAHNLDTKRYIEKYFSAAIYGDNAESESTANERVFAKRAAELVRLNPKLIDFD